MPSTSLADSRQEVDMNANLQDTLKKSRDVPGWLSWTVILLAISLTGISIIPSFDH